MRTIDSFGKRFFLLRLLDWEIWTAAIMSDTNTRDMLISAVAQYAANGQNDAPFSDWYETTDGKEAGVRARPVVGGHFALVSGISQV